MTLKSAIIAYLKSNAGVLAVLTSAKVYANTAPTASPNPLLVVHSGGDVADRSLNKGLSGLSQARIEVDVYADDTDTFEALKTAVRKALDFVLNGTTVNTVSIRTCSLAQEEVDSYRVPTDSSQRGQFFETLNFSIWYDFK
jgi:hypothetical protein